MVGCVRPELVTSSTYMSALAQVQVVQVTNKGLTQAYHLLELSIFILPQENENNYLLRVTINESLTCCRSSTPFWIWFSQVATIFFQSAKWNPTHYMCYFQPTILNLPFPTYHSQQWWVDSDLTLTKITVQGTFPPIGVVE